MAKVLPACKISGLVEEDIGALYLPANSIPSHPIHSIHPIPRCYIHVRLCFQYFYNNLLQHTCGFFPHPLSPKNPDWGIMTYCSHGTLRPSFLFRCDSISHLLWSVSEWVMFSDFGDSHRIHRACRFFWTEEQQEELGFPVVGFWWLP